METLQQHVIQILEFLNKGNLIAARIYLIKHLKNHGVGANTIMNHKSHLVSFLNCLIELINNNSSAVGPADQAPVFPHISLLSAAAPSNSPPQDQESLARISVLLDELYERRIMDYLALVRLCYTCIKAERYVVLLYVDRVMLTRLSIQTPSLPHFTYLHLQTVI